MVLNQTFESICGKCGDEASTDGRKTGRTPAGSPKQDAEDYRRAVRL